MSDLLWQKPGVTVDADIQAFLAGDDVVLDRDFFLHDIRASRAHAEGLERIGILSADELAGIGRELERLADDFRSGSFILDGRYEDGHSAIEARLTERLGAPAPLHTGRSATIRCWRHALWLKEKLARTRALCGEIGGIALERARAGADGPLPGYTHLQRAVVSSLGMWWAAWAEAFIDNARRADDTLAWVDANPLGSAAGYGVNLPLEREHTTAALGFGRMQVAATYAQLSRGKFEMAAWKRWAARRSTSSPAWDLAVHARSSASSPAGAVHHRQRDQHNSAIRRLEDARVLASVAGALCEIEKCCRCPSGYTRPAGLEGALFHGLGQGPEGDGDAARPDSHLDWDQRMRAAWNRR